MAAIRPQDVLFHAGATAFAAYGRPVRVLSPVESAMPSMARASAAHLVDRGGLLRPSLADILRVSRWDTDGDGIFEARAMLLEPARTNGWATATEDYADAAWTKFNATISSNATTAPNGVAASADEIVGSGAGNIEHGVSRATPTLTDNTRSSVWWIVKADEITQCYIRTNDKANVFRNTWFNLATGVVGTKDAGHDAFVRRLANGWVFVGVNFDASSGATAPVARLRLAPADNTLTYDIASFPGGIFVWESAIEVDKAFPSEPGSILPNGLARAADSLTQSVAFGPQDLTVYAKWIRPLYADTTDVSLLRLRIFKLSTVAPFIDLEAIRNSGGSNRIVNPQIISTGGTFAQTSTNVPAGQVQEAAAQFKDFATNPEVRLDVGIGFGPFSSGNAIPFTAFGNQTLEIGGGSAGVQLAGGLITLLGVRGLRSLQECRDWLTALPQAA